MSDFSSMYGAAFRAVIYAVGAVAFLAGGLIAALVVWAAR